jgi:hypothetical protein
MKKIGEKICGRFDQKGNPHATETCRLIIGRGLV